MIFRFGHPTLRATPGPTIFYKTLERLAQENFGGNGEEHSFLGIMNTHHGGTLIGSQGRPLVDKGYID
jgi:hypothetical protein